MSVPGFPSVMSFILLIARWKGGDFNVCPHLVPPCVSCLFLTSCKVEKE